MLSGVADVEGQKNVAWECLVQELDQISWTVFINGIFFDWAFKLRLLVNIEPGSVEP